MYFSYCNKIKNKKKGYLVAYELADDEVALILRPISFNADGEWSGLVSTGLAMGPEQSIDRTIVAELIKCATFLSAFLDIAHEFPDIMEIVEERRNEMIKIFEQDAEEQRNGLPEVEIETSGGNVIKFGPLTKTKGSA
jgi:hypothetical protein|tara:strand:+ start:22 stop:435 length:414 start_codon:yes stop_codon:yes gene_type:complete